MNDVDFTITIGIHTWTSFDGSYGLLLLDGALTGTLHFIGGTLT
jgi:hypothetical protein